MYFLKLLLIFGVAFLVYGEKRGRYRDNRQHWNHNGRNGHNGRKSASVPPYAVPMDPIPVYSPRDPLYNPPEPQSKSDDSSFYYEETPYNYYPTEPEPIIEIIIKESNESLPAPPQPPSTPAQPKKEPIQVFYVKYEKKQEYGDEKPRVVYDAPIPALTPVEEHEVVEPDRDRNADHSGRSRDTTEAPYFKEPSTTLRAIIKPESEVYHSGASGIKVTFGNEQLPPNSHQKRSDKELASEKVKPTSLSSIGATKRAHIPYIPITSAGARQTSGFPQQRIVNSFSNQQQLLGPNPTLNYQQQLPSFTHQPPFHQSSPPHVRTTHQPHLNHRQQRPPINVQGLPDYHKRTQFTSFVPPHRVNINHPQHPGQVTATSVSHQNVQLHNYPQPPSSNSPPIFNHDAPFKFKQQEKPNRYFQPQQRPTEHQILQEQQRIAEQQRRKLEQEHKLQYHQHHYQHQQQKLQNHLQSASLQNQQQYNQHQEFKVGTSIQTQQIRDQPTKQSEIVKSIPKLEQHYAIRENPLYPGPFPPNPQHVTTTTFGIFQNPHQYTNSHHQATNFPSPTPNQQIDNYPKQKLYQNEQSFFAQNLPTPQQQRPTSPEPVSPWQRPTYRGKYSSQKIFATPITKTNDLDSQKYQSTPNSLQFAPTTYRSATFGSSRYTSSQYITTVTPPTTTTTTTTTTTKNPKSELKIKENIANLPDEIPEDIRQQLLSSGILGNADIQVLDYDKIGGLNIENLPPEALANFYSAGGLSATSSASEPVPQLAKKPKNVDLRKVEMQLAESKFSSTGKNSRAQKIEPVTLRPSGVEMKVVRFDPNTAQGQSIADKHIDNDATRLNPVPVVNDREDSSIAGQFNRYIPLKVSGASFPIPNVPELSGKKISSVVVLAPVDYTFKPEDAAIANEEVPRNGRKLQPLKVQTIKFLAGDSLKQLMKKPSSDNYKRWLDQEKTTVPQKQSVILLVTAFLNDKSGKKEIYMYDVVTQQVNKLAGDLSSAFVDAAESNSNVSIHDAIN